MDIAMLPWFLSLGILIGRVRGIFREKLERGGKGFEPQRARRTQRKSHRENLFVKSLKIWKKSFYPELSK
jgi:hypothetical protein